MGYNAPKALQSPDRRLVLANALVWGVLILGLAYVLRGTPDAGIIVILASGAAATSISLLLRRLSRDGRAD
jgi:hypothetical protein